MEIIKINEFDKTPSIKTNSKNEKHYHECFRIGNMEGNGIKAGHINLLQGRNTSERGSYAFPILQVFPFVLFHQCLCLHRCAVRRI